MNLCRIRPVHINSIQLIRPVSSHVMNKRLRMSRMFDQVCDTNCWMMRVKYS